MGRVDKELRLRNEGMDFALRIVREGGIEALEKEIRERGITGISLNVPQSEVNRASEKMKWHSTITAIAIAVVTLRRHFYFNDSQTQKFKELFDSEVNRCCEDPDRLAMIMAEADVEVEEV